MKTTKTDEFTQVTLERQVHYAELYVTSEEFRQDHYRQAMLCRLRATVFARLASRIVIDEKAYVTWWDHFKASCLPTWLLRRLKPVQVKHIQIDQPIYRDLVQLPSSEREQQYYQFTDPIRT